MARRLRFIPEGGALVEVTCRTIHGRFLLTPTKLLRSIVLGVLGRAQRLYPVELHAFVFMSNHYHLLLSVRDAHQLACFMNYLNSNLAREAGRVHRWREKFWGRRYQAIVVSPEEKAQVGRLRYILSHGCKENLVARPRDWPGANSVRALVETKKLCGMWFDRTRECGARVRGQEVEPTEFVSRETIRLFPIPCWQHLPERQYSAKVADLVTQIETDTAAKHTQNGTRPLGVKKILSQPVQDRPMKLKREPAPSFHTATETTHREFAEAYHWFVGLYRQATQKLRRGDLSATFPLGSFPPRLPFVDSGSSLAPG